MRSVALALAVAVLAACSSTSTDPAVASGEAAAKKFVCPAAAPVQAVMGTPLKAPVRVAEKSLSVFCRYDATTLGKTGPLVSVTFGGDHNGFEQLKKVEAIALPGGSAPAVRDYPGVGDAAILVSSYDNVLKSTTRQLTVLAKDRFISVVIDEQLTLPKAVRLVGLFS